MLRIIAGKYGGRQLEQPSLDTTRATTDRIREAIFSSIQFDIEGAIVLDLFSGSGAFSFESVSRGAMKSIAIEKDRKAASVIEHNKQTLKITNVDIFKMDALSYIKSKAGAKFNFIFVDPPYEDTELYNETLSAIKSSDLLGQNGYIILETDDPKKIVIPEGYMVQRTKKYGKISVLFISNI
ncbi:16S rRNA (guanine(966)-N(2))-methyltransferase RsmD [Mycoplasma todarodis]|uniref:16S rRNA (Guanine(966)-N(2))-methyltransferase RsmD n=1 Tax=Mycoplasma todarodis TaxID=1937191 RepID=A0A4R0XQ93_9MOLU|nr:16S rRNA (guanine(966)-N(2))-methyltransferase RsmD [Mycoplasma todarodis]TCG10500.1 16S rRNA (guanine(966)-N(2))-methyltransferase RsmD [Mycoplasma todarodis]